MSTTAEQHKAEAPDSIRCAVITVSDTRTRENDRGGSLVSELLNASGHSVVAREIVPDEPERMRSVLDPLLGRDDVQAILMTGGTGISRRDQTFETVAAMMSKEIYGYGELFRMLSYQEIGSAAMLSRAVGGLVRGRVLLTMPGSPAAVRLAMEKIILPELSHMVREASK